MADLKSILAKLNANASSDDRALITRAHEFAAKAHEGITRYSGDPYITHLSAVAEMLAEMGMGPKTITAALLHDIIEDTDITSEEVYEQFGQEILFLVEGVTKLGSVRYHGTDRHNESLRKLFVATSEDIRVLIIKLTDRLHNMQTLEYIPKEKQLRIARETLEIYVPVAHRLGMGRIRRDLEDLAFPYVYPEEYKKVEELVQPLMKYALENLEKSRKRLQKKLAEAGVKDFKTHYRVKGMYSLFRKLERREWNIDKIHDLLAIRVVIPTVEQCYQALGVIHELWRPLPRRMKDYIAFPKPNGYQSLHTTIIAGDERTILEIQIRTEEMHRRAEFGVASHLSYKSTQSGVKETLKQQRTWMTDLIPSLFRPFSWRRKQAVAPPKKEKPEYTKDQVPNWIKEIADAHKEAVSTGEFVSDLRQDFFSHRIFAFTPEGDVIDLPIGASPIDFAYAVHTDIGNHTSGVRVNGKFVQLNTELKNGDMVEIETKKNSHPTRKWLEFAKTSLAQRSIRSALSDSGPKKKKATKKNS